MPSVLPSGKVLSDPVTSVGRVLFIEEPLIHRTDFPRSMHPMLHRAMERVEEDPAMRGHLEVYWQYHHRASKNLAKLEGREVILVNGVSVDNSPENPRRLGIDHTSDLNRLKREQRAIFQRHPRIDSTHYVFFPVGPFHDPYFFDTDFIDRSVFEQEWGEANGFVWWKFQLGAPVGLAEPDFKQAVWKFSETLYSAELAKRQFWDKYDEELIEASCAFNRRATALAIASYLSRLRLGEVHIYAMKKSSSYKIARAAARRAGTALRDFGLVMRNAAYSREAECTPSCLSILENFIETTWGAKYAGLRDVS